MRIFLDMDEVLCELLEDWMRMYNKDYNDRVEISDIKYWDQRKNVKAECGDKIFDYLNVKGLFRNLKPIDGAIDGVKALLKQGHDVYIVTNPPVTSPYALEEKKEWLKEYLPEMVGDKPRYIFTCHKYLLQGDILFDDCPEYLRTFTGISVAYDYPYNQRFKSNFRVKNWGEFLELVHKLRGLK